MSGERQRRGDGDRERIEEVLVTKERTKGQYNRDSSILSIRSKMYSSQDERRASNRRFVSLNPGSDWENNLLGSELETRGLLVSNPRCH